MAKKKENKNPQNNLSVNLGITQNSLNENLMGAIKESNDPTAKLKKLKSPLSPFGCFINIIFLIVLTIIVGLIICAIMIDKFNLGVVVKDILNKFGIINWLNAIKEWVVGIFNKS